MSQFIEMFGDPVSWQTDTSLPTLNDTVNVISGFPFDSEKFDTEGVGTPLIRIRDIQRGYSETFTTEVFDEQYRIKKYELLVGMDGMFDIARWQSDEAALNQRVCCLRMKGSENDTFIQYLVQPILKHIENGTNATTVKHISTKQINGIRVPIASHEQKNKFAMIANQADKSGFDGRKSQFIEMFGIAEATKPLADFIEVSFPGEWGQEDKDGSGVKVIRTTNFTNNGKLDLSEVVTRDIDSAKIEKKKLFKGDIILERSGGTNDNPVGRVVYFEEDGVYLFNNFTQLLRCKEGVNSLFIFYSLFNYYQMNKNVIRSMGNKTTGIQNLKMDRYWQIPIADVSIELQKEFESIYRQADKSGFRTS